MAHGCRFYKGKDTGISFASWMPFAIPPMLLCLLGAWLWLQVALFDNTAWWRRRRLDSKEREREERNDREQYARVTKVLTDKYVALGPMGSDDSLHHVHSE